MLKILIQIMHTIRRSATPDRSDIRHITDAQARDIGLSASEVERLRFTYPSRNTVHRGL